METLRVERKQAKALFPMRPFINNCVFVIPHNSKTEKKLKKFFA